MKYLLICSLLLLSACASTRQLITSTADIAKKIDDGKTVEKANVLLESLNEATCNANQTLVVLNERFPELMDKLDKVADQSLVGLQNIGGVASNLNIGLQSFRIVGDNLSNVLTNTAQAVSTWNMVGVNISAVSTNINHLVSTWDNVGGQVAKISASLNGKTPEGEDSFWMKKLKSVLPTILLVLKYGAVVLCLILLRILWVISREVHDADNHTKNNILTVNGRKGHWSRMAFSRLLVLQDKLSKKSNSS